MSAKIAARSRLRGKTHLLSLALFAIVSVCNSAIASARQAAKPPDWEAWQFLLGEWEGKGGGAPGQGAGGFTFALDLQKRILVRRNRSDYPATSNQPAFSHEDLMVIYQEADKPAARAIYFDNEGHVIHYSVEFSPDQNSLVFLSEASPSAPQFRLTYNKAARNSLAIKFEIASPGAPGKFSTYLQAVVQKKEG
jgi:hypothetical protein